VEEEVIGALPEITLAMFKAGVNAFKCWNPDEADAEALVANVFFAMYEVSSLKSRRGSVFQAE
jgi:hypothetical protein